MSPEKVEVKLPAAVSDNNKIKTYFSLSASCLSRVQRDINAKNFNNANKTKIKLNRKGKEMCELWTLYYE